MKDKGNGTPQQCVQNLIKTIRGEVPYERIKGINSRLIDEPASLSTSLLSSDIKFIVKTYEPRTNLTNADVIALVAEIGSFLADVKIVNR